MRSDRKQGNASRAIQAGVSVHFAVFTSARIVRTAKSSGWRTPPGLPDDRYDHCVRNQKPLKSPVLAIESTLRHATCFRPLLRRRIRRCSIASASRQYLTTFTRVECSAVLRTISPAPPQDHGRGTVLRLVAIWTSRGRRPRGLRHGADRPAGSPRVSNISRELKRREWKPMNGTKLITVAALIVVSLAGYLPGARPAEEVVGMAQQARGLGLRIPDRRRARTRALADRPRHETCPRRAGARHRPLRLRRHPESVPGGRRTRPAGLRPRAFRLGAQNNVAQSNRGIGHHVTINCFQNCAWNTPDAASTAEEWMNSRGHRANMLEPLGHPLRHRVWAGAVLDDERDDRMSSSYSLSRG